jgi:hypothetical protein
MIEGAWTVEQIGEYLRVAGSPDGTDWWILLPHGRAEFSCGVAGPAHVWYAERSGRVCILDASSRRQLAIIDLAGYSATGALTPAATVSRDGRRIYVVHRLSPPALDQGRVHVIDVSAGAVVAVHGPLPTRLGARPLERPDGRLLLPTLRQSLVLLDQSLDQRLASTSGRRAFDREMGDKIRARHFEAAGSPRARPASRSCCNGSTWSGRAQAGICRTRSSWRSRTRSAWHARHRRIHTPDTKPLVDTLFHK